MTVPDRDALKALETLSAMVDGEADARSVEQVCSSWRQDVSVRARWHSYHLIGDVLRSEELGAGFRADEALLQRVRERLADEPVVLAPLVGNGAEDPALARLGARSVIAMSGRRRTWGAPIAVAAGFVAMAGLLVAVRQPSPAGLNGPQVSLMSLPTPALSAGGGESSLTQGLSSNPGTDLTGQGGATLVVADNVLRDAKLDRYLAAHQEFSGTTALGETSGFLRSATYEVSPR